VIGSFAMNVVITVDAADVGFVAEVWHLYVGVCLTVLLIG